MSFWSLSDGTKAEQNTTFEISGGNIEPIPNDTTCVGAIEEAKWDEYKDQRYISIKWRIAQPEEYANRVVFQKVKIFGFESDKDQSATSDKAKRMLMAIDTNAGGKLAEMTGEPSDMDLMSALVGKLMAIKIMVWQIKDEKGEVKEGNWIAAVAPTTAKAAKPVKTEAPTVKMEAPHETLSASEDIPF